LAKFQLKVALGHSLPFPIITLQIFKLNTNSNIITLEYKMSIMVSFTKPLGSSPFSSSTHILHNSQGLNILISNTAKIWKSRATSCLKHSYLKTIVEKPKTKSNKTFHKKHLALHSKKPID
jgi:hypothetical protein